MRRNSFRRAYLLAFPYIMTIKPLQYIAFFFLITSFNFTEILHSIHRIYLRILYDSRNENTQFS
jgi:hypothetical protein